MDQSCGNVPFILKPSLRVSHEYVHSNHGLFKANDIENG